MLLLTGSTSVILWQIIACATPPTLFTSFSFVFAISIEVQSTKNPFFSFTKRAQNNGQQYCLKVRQFEIPTLLTENCYNEFSNGTKRNHFYTQREFFLLRFQCMHLGFLYQTRHWIRYPCRLSEMVKNNGDHKHLILHKKSKQLK